MSDAGSGTSQGPSPRPRSEPEEEANEDSCSQDVLEKLKQQVAKVTHGRSRKVSSEDVVRIQGGRRSPSAHVHSLLPWSIWQRDMVE